MKQIIKRLILVVSCLLTLLVTDTYASLDIQLDGIDSKQHKVSEYIGQGKWVVLNIWGTRCPPCLEEVPELVAYHDEYKNKDSIVLGIAIDFPSYGYANKNEVTNFSNDYLIDFPILLSDSTITEKLGLGRLEGLPTTYIFDPEGKVVGMQVGGITKEILENFINKLREESK